MFNILRTGVGAVCLFTCASALAADNARADTENEDLQRLAAEYYDRKYQVGMEEAYRRIAIQDRASGLEDAVERIVGRDYAGIWFDPQDRGRLKLGLTAVGATRQAELRSLLEREGLATDADFVSVRFSEIELEAMVADVVRIASDLLARGRVRVGYSTVLNNVVLTTVNALSARDAALVAEIDRRDGVTVERVDAPSLYAEPFAYSCGVRRCDPPLRGGREINSSFSFNGLTVGVTCTAAFIARHHATGQWLVMTAGHCLNYDLLSTWTARNQAQTNSTKIIGSTYGYVWGGGADAGVIAVDPGGYWDNPQPAPWIVVKASDDTTYDPEYRIRNDGKSSMYTMKCVTGRTTGTHCAEIVGLGLSVTYVVGGVNIVVNNLGVLDACVATKGDSGGPVYKHNTAFGILSGGTVFPDPACDTYYQGIRGAENLLNVDVEFAPPGT